MKCSFCSSEIRRGTGLTYAKVDGTVMNFCSRRCMVYSIAKRDPRKFKWAQSNK